MFFSIKNNYINCIMNKYIYLCYNNSDKLFCLSDEKNKDLKIFKSLISMGYIRIYYDDLFSPIINTPREYNILDGKKIINNNYPTIYNLFNFIMENQQIIDIINYIKINRNEFLNKYIEKNIYNNYNIIIVNKELTRLDITSY